MDQPFVKINNHEAWKEEIVQLLEDVLEVENVLSFGYDPKRERYTFPLHNLSYEPKLQTVEKKKEEAGAPRINFESQSRSTGEMSKFSETGNLMVQIDHEVYEIDDAVRLLRSFFREKDDAMAKTWPAKRIREFIESGLRAAGQDASFLSRANFLRTQQAFGYLFRGGGEHPRYTRVATEIEVVDLKAVGYQSFSEAALKDYGNIWYVAEAPPDFTGSEVQLWEQYKNAVTVAKIDASLLSEDKQRIASHIHQVDLRQFKTPMNLHYSSHEPERRFSELLFANADLFDAFVKMPDRAGYSLPYSYKPAKAARTHVANENFHPDFFIKLAGKSETLVVEIKDDDDDSNRNRAKYRDGKEHFATLNERLKGVGEKWRYYFKFLSPEDMTHFFRAVKDGTYQAWKSSLMIRLEKSVSTP